MRTVEQRSNYTYETRQCSICGAYAVDDGERLECPSCGLAAPRGKDAVERFQRWWLLNMAIRGQQTGWFSLMEDVPFSE